jgi:hypothetical protein
MQCMSNLERLRLDNGAEHLHRLGARATAEFLAELAATIGGQPAILRLLAEYQNRLSPKLLRAAGGDRFPPRRPRVVPADAGRVSA